MESTTNRRRFLKMGISGAGLALIASPMSKTLASACGLTPPQTSGPFYPGEENFHADNDLTLIAGHSARAQGKIIYIQGQVTDAGCKPIAGVNVEIWQACTSGKYNHKDDTNTAPLDFDFKYWGETFTNSEGKYIFKTVVPGAYPADADWTRPPHVHFKISKLGYQDLITQMYFKGNQYNDKDLILQNIPANERGRVIVDFEPASVEFEPHSLIGTFDVTIVSIR